MKANATTNKVNEIIERGFITESEINLLKNRVNNGRADVCELDDLGGLAITDEQTAKDLNWLLNKWKTPRGTERKNNPFGYREEDILENFDHSSWQASTMQDVVSPFTCLCTMYAQRMADALNTTFGAVKFR